MCRVFSLCNSYQCEQR
uniref:Uncharacterized protein n=1 Tax=Anopheles arabiensis TaxID=7173 RepID=A0A182IFL7_ANOAR